MEGNKIPVKNFDEANPIDVATAIEDNGGEAEVFYSQLEDYEETLEENMTKIVAEYDGKNHEAFKTIAHSIKGTSAYIGAGRLHYVCYFIQENFVQKHLDHELEFYPSLVEAAIEFKICSRKLLAEHNGEPPYQPTADDEKIVCSDQFTLEKDGTGYVYCLAKGQSLA